MTRFALAAVLLVLPGIGHAQAPQPEVRADILGPEPVNWHLGAGLTWALGHYTRVSTIGSYGVPSEPESDAEWRGDLLVRVTLDPFRERRFGLSLGGGMTVRHRPYLLAVAEVEGPATNGFTVALQAGFGGGPRAGLVLRRAVPGRR